MREKKWGLLLPGLVLLLLVSLLAFSCAKQQTTPGETKTLRVGICLPLSGPCAAWGIPFRNGAALVADMRNAEGGLQIGNDRYIVELYEQDSKFTAEGAATATRNLLERSKVDLIYGSLSTAELVAELGITEPARILVVHAAAGDETISKASEIRYAFRAWVSYDHTFPALLGWVSKTYPLAKNIALLNPNIESSWSGDELAKKVAASLGMSVVYNDYFEEGTQDFTPFLVKALAAKPDFLLNTATSTPDWGLMMKQARDLGYEGLFLDIHMLDITGLTPIAGADVVEGMIGIGDVSVGPSVKQGTEDFVDAYIQKYGEWSVYALVQPPALDAMFQAFEQAGTLDTDKVLAILESGKIWDTVTGVSGVFAGTSMYGLPHQWLCPQYIHVCENGQDVIIAEISLDELLEMAGD